MSRNNRGFTIVELTIAVAFLSVLMLAILTISMAAGKMYVKGDTNKAINQAGRDFSDAIRRDFLAAGVGTITPPIINNVGPVDNPLISGRMCLGAVDYLWNTAALLNSSSAAAEGAKIRMSNGRPIKFWDEIRPVIKESGGRNLSILVQRGSEEKTFAVKPKLSRAKNIFGEEESTYLIGISPAGRTAGHRKGPARSTPTSVPRSGGA